MVLVCVACSIVRVATVYAYLECIQLQRMHSCADIHLASVFWKHNYFFIHRKHKLNLGVLVLPMSGFSLACSLGSNSVIENISTGFKFVPF